MSLNLISIPAVHFLRPDGSFQPLPPEALLQIEHTPEPEPVTSDVSEVEAEPVTSVSTEVEPEPVVLAPAIRHWPASASSTPCSADWARSRRCGMPRKNQARAKQRFVGCPTDCVFALNSGRRPRG